MLIFLKVLVGIFILTSIMHISFKCYFIDINGKNLTTIQFYYENMKFFVKKG